MNERNDFQRAFDPHVYDRAYFEGSGDKSGYQSYSLAKEMLRNQYRMIDEVMVNRVQSRKALDVACAYGFGMRMLQERGWDVHGFDISEHAIEQLHTLYGENLKAGVADALDPNLWANLLNDEPYEKFGLVTANEFFEHIPSKGAEMVAESMAHVADWGFFVINAAVSPTEDTKEAALTDHGHLNHHDLTWWIKLFSRFGRIDYEAMHEFGRRAYQYNPEVRWHSRALVVQFGKV